MKRRSFLLSSLGLTAAFAAGTHVRAATSSTDIIRVEEDWYIKVGDPDPAIDAPQIVTVFGPVDPIEKSVRIRGVSPCERGMSN